MDAASNDEWDKSSDFVTPPADGILGYFSSMDAPFASRKGFRPAYGLSIINKFNDKLRSSYGMD
jgi:hypothetical protein